MFNILLKEYVDVTACSDFGFETIPGELAGIVHVIYNAILIGVPLLLILFGMLDLGKAVMAQKEDEIKKGQQTFIKRLIAAAIVFFVLLIVKLLLGLVSSDGDSLFTCIKGIIDPLPKS